ncbi:MAG: peptide chain release factor N(5)-glutamine methyltransferase [Spirochaetia bacterium]
MTVREALERAHHALAAAGIETPRLDATVLLAHAAGWNKARLLASYPENLEKGTMLLFENFIEKRLSGLPVSYIRGFKEFYGLEFRVDKRVLVPRPDTETLVDAAAQIIRQTPDALRVLDVCTGSGCVAITLQHLFPHITVHASDISSFSLEVFKKNSSEILGYEMKAVESDLFDKIDGKFDLITANPPYLSDDEYALMEKEKWPEPKNALAAGEDGLEIIRELIPRSLEYLFMNGYVLLEAAYWQMNEIRQIMEEAGFSDVSIHRDLAGRQRVIIGKKRKV